MSPLEVLPARMDLFINGKKIVGGKKASRSTQSSLKFSFLIFFSLSFSFPPWLPAGSSSQASCRAYPVSLLSQSSLCKLLFIEQHRSLSVPEIGLVFSCRHIIFSMPPTLQSQLFVGNHTHAPPAGTAKICQSPSSTTLRIPMSTLMSRASTPTITSSSCSRTASGITRGHRPTALP